MSQEPRADALAALSQFLVSECSLGETLERIAAIAVDVLPAAEFAGISMLDADGRVTTGVFTDPEAPEIDSAQYESGRGPCLDAWRTGSVVRIEDMAQAVDTYPEFSAAASEHGVQSTLSLPLIAGEEFVGALNMYSHRVHGFTHDDERLGMDLAKAAAVLMINAEAYWHTFELGQNLSTALQTRGFIEQAKGMLMATSSTMTADEAFEILKRASQRENVKIRDIAQRIVGRQGPMPSA